MPPDGRAKLQLHDTGDPSQLFQQFIAKKRALQELETRPGTSEDTKYAITPEILRVLQRAHALAQHHDRTRLALYLPRPGGAPEHPGPDPPWVPAEILKEAVWTVRADDSSLSYETLVAATAVVVPTAPPPPPPNDELRQRLDQLRFQQERRDYDALTRNVTFRRQEEREREPLSGFLFQAGLGVDLLVMVFAGALIGYYLAQWNGWSPQARWISAAAGLSVMVVVEGLLVVIKFGKVDQAVVDTANRRKAGAPVAPLSVPHSTPSTPSPANPFAPSAPSATAPSADTPSDAPLDSKKDR